MQNYCDGSEIELNSQPKGVKSKILKFLRNSFRPRGKDGCLRVLSGGQKGAPWLYLRVFFFGLILFTLNVIVYRLTQMTVSYIASIIIGGLVFNLTVLMLFYELYPHGDISFLTLFTVTVCGGALTVALLSLGYEFIYSGDGANPWISTIWTGFWEESVKAVFAVLAVLLLKKKDPLACFLIGFAVGTGYSVFEDIAYIYSYSRIERVYWIVLMSVGRGLSCAFSHAPWTGVICWAFARFEKPFINFRFYLAFIVCAVLHYLADVPFFAEEVMFLKGLNWGWLMEAVVVASIIAIMYFIFRENRADVPPAEEDYAPIRSEKLSRAADITAVMCAVVLCAVSLFGCAVTKKTVSDYEIFTDNAAFVNYVQEGLPLKADLNRPLSGENYAEYRVDGKLRSFTQTEVKDGFTYFYMYGVYSETADEEQREVIYLDGVAVKIIEEDEEKLCYMSVLSVYEDDYTETVFRPYNYSPVPDGDLPEVNTDGGEKTPVFTVEYFRLTGRGVSYDFEQNGIKLVTSVREVNYTGLFIALGCVQGAILAGGVTAFTILKLKSRRFNDA